MKAEDENGWQFHALIVSKGRDYSNCKILLNSIPEDIASLGFNLSAKKSFGESWPNPSCLAAIEGL
jgi:hypothetical protein